MNDYLEFCKEGWIYKLHVCVCVCVRACMSANQLLLKKFLPFTSALAWLYVAPAYSHLELPTLAPAYSLIYSAHLS